MILLPQLYYTIIHFLIILFFILTVKFFNLQVDGYQTPENSDINVCERVLKAVDAVLSAETPHWLKSSEFVMRLHTSTKTLLQIRKNCSQGKWHQVVEVRLNIENNENVVNIVYALLIEL